MTLDSGIMANIMLPFLVCSFMFASLRLNCYGYEDNKKIHVVYMGDLPKGEKSISSTHHTMLEDVLGSPSLAKESLVYSYGRSFNGFAARLSEEEVERLAEMEGVVSVLPNTQLKLHTTRSWDFMNFTKSYAGGSYEGDVIIGLLDTGIWPESESFSDEGLGPPPAKWNGTCQMANNFTCNNKIIGARFYNSENIYAKSDIKSPRDSKGHGSHTASTAAGRAVNGASYYGLGVGVARGAVPKSRIAVYKVCWWFGCFLADVMAAFDDAIADGVDILSVSFGIDEKYEYFQDPIAIGSFHAMKNGILTSNSAGNSGPWPLTVSNYSPWSLTVAASSIDRKFPSLVVLGNGQTIIGNSINSFDLNGTSFPLVWGGDAANSSAGCNTRISRTCLPGSLNAVKIEGKIVLCDIRWDTSGISMAKGVGTIMTTGSFNDYAYRFPVPATMISDEDNQNILDYIRSTENPTATILVSETTKDVMAPIVVSFSSRGPNPISPDILKPDLTAPGVDILAAWSPVGPPSDDYLDDRSVKYNIISGTSMSCPHATGAAAYVKSVHPTWSPAAIKSALMTTAAAMDRDRNEGAEFAYGSGHINPVKAADPGLVYDASTEEYVVFLCKQGYNTTAIGLITGDPNACSSTKPGKTWDLNYPSFALSIEDGQEIMGIFTRTVTNVGSPNSTYCSTTCMPSTLRVTIEPSVLKFSSIGEKKTFKVKVFGPKITQVPIIAGGIVWEDGIHVVRSPLVVYTTLPPTYSTYSSHSRSMKETDLFGGSFMYRRNGHAGATKYFTTDED